MATQLSKPYTVTNADNQAEDMDRMFEELYRAIADLQSSSTSTGSGSGGGLTFAQVSARVLHEL